MLKVVKAQGIGLVSDLGRPGYLGQGVPIGGTMDTYSMVLANAALGNASHDAVLECMGTFELVVSKPGSLMVGTRSGRVLVNKAAVMPGRVVWTDVGDIIDIQPAHLAWWTVLALRGGVRVPEVLGSRSTCMAGQFGGLEGRALKVGDVIHTHPAEHDRFDRNARTTAIGLAMPLAHATQGDPRKVPVDIACLPGPELPQVGDEGLHLLFQQIYTVQAQSNRQAFRLKAHRALPTHRMPAMKSHAVHPGLIQLPPDGQPIVLMPDAQATGGYPRVASVLSSQMWKLGQMAPGQRVRFKLVDFEQAISLNQAHERERIEFLQLVEQHFHQR